MAYIDNRGDELNRQNEEYLRDRIKALQARVKELEADLKGYKMLDAHERLQRLVTGNVRTIKRGGWGNG
jgi:predicted ribosome quality control (RQC) complex YloA/Tae2 family protein